MTAADSRPPAPPDYTAALSRVAHRYREAGVLAVAGVDRVAFLQGQLTQDVRQISAGSSLPAAGLSPKGKLLYYGRVVGLAERLLLLVPGASRGAVAAHLAKYAAFQKVSVADVSDEFLLLGLYGPGAGRVVAPEGSTGLPGEGEFASGLLVSSRSRTDLEKRLDEAGSLAVSAATAEILRAEAGRPRLGSDADESNLPDELHLQDAISTTKGCYVGQEVVARLRTYGRVNRRLVGFRFSGRPVPAGTVFPDPEKPGLELGRVTTSVTSPRFGAIGIGFAFRGILEGQTLTSSADPDLRAVVAPLPFS